MALRITGSDRISFLQGLITNDVDKVTDGLVYAALLTPQGKYIADFFVHADGDALVLDVAPSVEATLAQRLSMYRLRADVAIEQIDLPVARGLGPVPEGAFADPRHPLLGWRAYDGQPGQDVDWRDLEVRCVVPQAGAELTPDTYILEAGFERLRGVDFKKGCYVGQEVTARMKHKTELRKGLAQVAVSSRVPVGTEITKDGKAVGTLFRQADGLGIAHLRFDRAGPGMTAGEAQVDFQA